MIKSGRVFQARGAATANAQSEVWQVRRVTCTSSLAVTDDDRMDDDLFYRDTSLCRR